AYATEAKTHPSGHTLQLIGLQRSVGGDDHNNGTLLLLLGQKNTSGGLCSTNRSRLAVSENCRRILNFCEAGFVTLDFAPNRNSGNANSTPPALVPLNQDAARESPRMGGKFPRRSPRAAFEAVAIHPGTASDIAFQNPTAAGRVESLKGVLLFDMLALHVV